MHATPNLDQPNPLLADHLLEDGELQAHESCGESCVESYVESLRNVEGDRYILRLYVAGNAINSLQTLQYVREVCDQSLAGQYDLEVIDIYESPDRLEADQIIATPTLVKEHPAPMQRVIGNLTDTEKLFDYLDL
jgi:circadian clock protein KaiB